MKLIYVTIGVVLACVAALLLVQGITADQVPAAKEPALAGDVVLVGLNAQGYTFAPSVIEAGKQVTFKNDGSVKGCAVLMVQPELGIDMDFSARDAYTFVPEKKGKFTVSCAMNMYHGTLEVV